jgi:hypothetical protein
VRKRRVVSRNAGPKVPKFLKCRGCEREREVSQFPGFAPRDCDPSRRHHTEIPSQPLVGIACPCGHYTSRGHEPFPPD